MTYWLDLFTGRTWGEFRNDGARVTGFRSLLKGTATHVKPGDVFVCYLTGVMRWVGALRVVGPSTDKRPIWKEAAFPVRFDVEPFIILEPEHGIPMDELSGRVAFYRGREDKGKFRGFVRRSPNRFASDGDGELIVGLLARAKESPVSRPVDPKKLGRLYRAERQHGKKKEATEVSIPEPDNTNESGTALTEEPTIASTRHTEIQYHLLALGAEMGLDVWVARNDRSKLWNGQALGTVPRMAPELPTQFNEATQRTIELIDVLWLKKNSIVAAFEVESTTSVYSGLLRMSDLLALQPNLEIKLYLVAPDERRAKVAQEILRPTFTLRDKPLSKICGFLSFSQLIAQVEGIRKLGLAGSLRPDFLERTAEFFAPES
jgi:hypothetical protein